MHDLTHIPHFPSSRALTLADRDLLDSLFAGLQPRVSELTFAGLYLFRNAHAYRLTRVGFAPVVLGQGYDGASYFLPPLTPEPGPALAALFAAGLALYGGDAAFVAQHCRGAGLHVVADRDNFDYLYRREELATLPGRRFHKKKNRLNYFSQRHAHEVALYAPVHRDSCLAILEQWERVKPPAAESSLVLEMAACAEALTLSNDLELQGVVVLVAGEVAAFALGERLNRETAVCHFEKANPFLEGVGQLVNREFSRLLFHDCIYLNREQDLGEPGLRQAKLSYYPVAMIEKYRVSPVSPATMVDGAGGVRSE